MNSDRLILILACLVTGTLGLGCRAPQKKITVAGDGTVVETGRAGWPAAPRQDRPVTDRPSAPWPATAMVTEAIPVGAADDAPVGRVAGDEPTPPDAPGAVAASAGVEDQSRQRQAEPARPTSGETESWPASAREGVRAGKNQGADCGREVGAAGGDVLRERGPETPRAGSDGVPGRDGEVAAAIKLVVGQTTATAERGGGAVLGLPAMGVSGVEGGRRAQRPIGLPAVGAVGAVAPVLPVLEAKPIYLEPILEPVAGRAEWRAWQAARQQAAAAARQAEREELRRSLQDWLRR